jgi:hypothetical protein
MHPKSRRDEVRAFFVYQGSSSHADLLLLSAVFAIFTGIIGLMAASFRSNKTLPSS